MAVVMLVVLVLLLAGCFFVWKQTKKNTEKINEGKSFLYGLAKTFFSSHLDIEESMAASKKKISFEFSGLYNCKHSMRHHIPLISTTTT